VDHDSETTCSRTYVFHLQVHFDVDADVDIVDTATIVTAPTVDDLDFQCNDEDTIPDEVSGSPIRSKPHSTSPFTPKASPAKTPTRLSSIAVTPSGTFTPTSNSNNNNNNNNNSVSRDRQAPCFSGHTQHNIDDALAEAEQQQEVESQQSRRNSRVAASGGSRLLRTAMTDATKDSSIITSKSQARSSNPNNTNNTTTTTTNTTNPSKKETRSITKAAKPTSGDTKKGRIRQTFTIVIDDVKKLKSTPPSAVSDADSSASSTTTISPSKKRDATTAALDQPLEPESNANTKRTAARPIAERAGEHQAKKAKLSRCQYWPACSRGDACLYHHPTEVCKYVMRLVFGATIVARCCLCLRW
jgi:hypothetical protein